jgi:hypothetical protein
MSAEIRATDKTYWILSNGMGYVDGITDSGLVTTVGNGLYIYWIGQNYLEYLSSCAEAGFVPRNQDKDTLRADQILVNKKIFDKISSLEPTVIPGQRISATQARLWLIQNGFDLNTINAVIDRIQDFTTRECVRAQWEYAPYLERNHYWLCELATILDIDLDKCFDEAALL